MVAGALLLPLLLAAGSFAHDLMRCRLTGAVIADGGCLDPGPDVTAQATLGDQSCCERQAALTSSFALGPESRCAPVLKAPSPLALGFLPPTYRPPYPFLARPPAPDTGRPAGGASLMLLKSSLLI